MIKFKFLQRVGRAGDKKGKRFGYIKSSTGKISIEHWKEGRNYYTQWRIIPKGESTGQNIGSVHKATVPINVENKRRDKQLKDFITSKFTDIKLEEVDGFLSEVVEKANELNEKLYPKEKPKDEEFVDIEGLNDYSDDVKDEAIGIYENDPIKYFMHVLSLVHNGDEETKEILLLTLFTKHVENGKPVCAIVVGTTESGKTSLVNKVSLISPARFLIETNSMSGKAAFYHQDAFREDYNHLVINDFLDSPEAIGTLKALTDTEISNAKHMTVSDDKAAVTLKVKGENTVVITAAQQLTDRELNRRLLHLNPDESIEHQNATKEFILEKESGISEYNEPKFDIAKAVYEKIIEDKYEVYVPWILTLNVELFGKTDLKHFTNLVKARTIINRVNRHEIVDGVLLASIDDFMAVLRLWNYISKMQATYLPSKAFEMMELLPKWDKKLYDEDGHFGYKIADLAKVMEVGRATVKRWLWGEEDQAGLIDMGYVHAEKDGDTQTSPWVMYASDEIASKMSGSEDEACSLSISEMFKHYLKDWDKKKAINSICSLFLIKNSYSDVNKNDLIKIVSQKFTKDIANDADILEICKIIAQELKNQPSD
ncbi:MAG: hypothetical protein ACPK7O_06800 [Methanobacterium sp.]